MFQRLSREDVDNYLTNRVEKGFTVIQAVVVSGVDGLVNPNVYENFVFIDNDPAQPNESYFEHVDYVVDKV